MIRSLTPIILAVVAGFFLVAAVIIGCIESPYFLAFSAGGVVCSTIVLMLTSQRSTPTIVFGRDVTVPQARAIPTRYRDMRWTERERN